MSIGRHPVTTINSTRFRDSAMRSNYSKLRPRLQMLTRSLVVLVTVCCTVGSASIAAAQGNVDRVNRRNGIESGNVTAVTPIGITLTKGGVESKIPAEEIRSILFSGEPQELARARRAADSGRYETALEILGQVSRENLKRAEVTQELDFLLASVKARAAIAGQVRPREGISAVGKFVNGNRTSYHLPEAFELLGKLHLASGDPQAATQQFETLGKAPAPYYRARSALLLGKVLQESDEHEQAIAKFDEALDAIGGNAAAETQRPEITLHRAISLSATGKLEPALADIKQALESASSGDIALLAQGYNALGDCYLAHDDPVAARNAYLHVDLVFNSAAPEHAQALYQLTQLWSDSGHSARAKDAAERLTKTYPQSRWAQR